MKTLAWKSRESLPLPSNADKLQEGWLECKRQHPWLMKRCYELCITAKRRGITRWSADAMFHVLRWETAVTTGDHDLKINNNYSSLAARDLMFDYPELRGYFQTRVRKARGNAGQVH